MKKVLLIVPVILLSMSGCASMQGHGAGGTKESFKDEYGRVCTAVKWGDSASVDCDFPQEK